MALDINFGLSMAADRIDDAAPSEALPYRSIAAIALLAHLTCLWFVADLIGAGFALAQTLSAMAAALTVFGIEAMQTSLRRGPWRWYLGLIPFLASCWFGIAGGVMLAMALGDWGTDELVAGLCGAVFSLWWNGGAVSRHGWAGR